MGVKDVASYDIFKLDNHGPVPAKYVLSFETGDGWFYRYVAQQRGDPFVFKHKRRPDMTISDDDVTPKSIGKFFDSHPLFDVVNEKIIYRGEFPE